MPPQTDARFRLNVAGILRDRHGRILICERLGRRGCWQFPQGGVDPGESLEGALHRELYEEIGVGPELIEVRNQAGPYRYEFDGIVVKGYSGKDQHFFFGALPWGGGRYLPRYASSGIPSFPLDFAGNL